MILKRSYIWFLQNGDTRISNDRLKRFEVDEKTKKTSQIAVGENQKMDSVSIGDWCLFENLSPNQCVIGLILEFGYINKKKIANYNETVSIEREEPKDVAVTCSWFSLKENLELSTLENVSTHGFVNIKQYILTIVKPKKIGDTFYISDDTLDR